MKPLPGVFFTLALLAINLCAQSAAITSVTQPTFGQAILDTAGNLYAYGSGPVTPGAAQTQNGGGTCVTSNGFFDFAGPCTDAYVAKVDPSGNLVFGTWLGGPTADQSTALAVDGAGNVFVTGTTGGQFPTTTNAAIPTSATATAWAAKISSDGSRLLYSTCLPATAATPSAIAIDAQGNAYIAGTAATGHAFVVKLSADGSAFLYNAAIGGTGQAAADAITADAAGNVVVAGQTASADFPVSPGALQSHLNGAQNVFIAKLDPTGRVLFSTYLGGSGTDTPAAVGLDATDNIYVAGQTSSLDFPTTPGSLQPVAAVPLWNNTSPAGFAARLTADGSAISWSTYVMSVDHPTYTTPVPPHEGVTQLAVTASGDTYIAGLTGAGFPVTATAPQLCYGGPDMDAFVAHLDSHGALADATYVGQNVSFVTALSVPGDGSVLLAWSNMRSQLQFGSGAPACLSPSILNSATLSGSPSVVPGEFITLTGFDIGPNTGVAYQPDAQSQIPRALAGVEVLFDGQPAPILYAQSEQINALAPVELSGRTQTTITVGYNLAMVGSIQATVMPYGSPGIFRAQPGVSAQAAAVNQDGTRNGPSNPAARGSVISVWGTGFGLIDPACATGGINPDGPVNLAAGLSVDITGGPEPPGYYPALYAGSAPTLPCGVEQINLVVPTDAPVGTYQLFPASLMELPAGGQSAFFGTVAVTISVK